MTGDASTKQSNKFYRLALAIAFGQSAAGARGRHLSSNAIVLGTNTETCYIASPLGSFSFLS